MFMNAKSLIRNKCILKKCCLTYPCVFCKVSALTLLGEGQKKMILKKSTLTGSMRQGVFSK